MALRIAAYRDALNASRIQDDVDRAWRAHIWPIRDALSDDALSALAAEYDERIIALPAWIEGP